MIKIISYGLGPIGIEAAKLALNKNNIEIVNAFDIDLDKIGKDLGELLNINKILGVKISKPLENLQKADIAVHATSSSFKKVYSQLTELVSSGINVVSSCEELLFPWHKEPKLAQDLDDLAKANNVTVLGTGVNPGFVMDRLALIFSGVCKSIRKIHAIRIVDASTRRLPLQRKIGAGLTVEEFKERENMGHVGLVESLALIADALNWKLNIEEKLNPVIAEKDIQTPFLNVNKGNVAGIDQTAIGTKNGEIKIKLDLKMYVGAEEPYDHILIEGEPDIDMKINKGIAGDHATVANLINSIPVVVKAKPGLLTVKDLAYPIII